MPNRRRRNPLRLQGNLAAAARSFRRRRNPLRLGGKLASAARSFRGADRPRKSRKPRTKGGLRGRKPGTKVRYGSYATRRYRSLWLRYQRSLHLVPLPQTATYYLFRPSRRRAKYHDVTTDNLLPGLVVTGSTEVSGTTQCPAPSASWSWINPQLSYGSEVVQHCIIPPVGGGTTSTPAGPGNCPGQVYVPPAGGTAVIAYAYWVHPSDGVPHPGIPFPLGFGWGCGTSHTVESPSDYPLYDSASNSVEYMTYFYYLVPGYSEESLLTVAVYSRFYNASDLPLAFPPPTETGSPFALIENYAAGFAFCQPDNSDPNLGYCPAATGGGGGGGGTPTDEYALAGGEWISNTISFPQAARIQVLVTYSTAFTATVDSAVTWNLNGTPGTLVIPARAIAGSAAVFATIDIPAGSTISFAISLKLNSHIDAAIVKIGGAYTCSCADYSKKHLKFPSRYRSELSDRDWAATRAGTPGYCKHIMAVQRVLGFPVDLNADDLKDIRQWRRDKAKRRTAARKAQRKAETQSRREARQRVRQDLRGLKRRDRAELKQLTANREYKKPKAQRFQPGADTY